MPSAFRFFCALSGILIVSAWHLQQLKIMDSSDFYYSHAGKQKCTYQIQNNRPMSEKQVQTLDSG